MSKTISNSISTGVTLTAAYDPLVITRTGTIATSGAAAIYGNTAQYWQITNSGLVDGLGSYGIDLLAASKVTNLGTVTSNGIALRVDNGAGRVTNSGTLSGFQDGIALTDGGTVTNTGTIGGILGAGIEIAGNAGTVTNSGTISGHEYAVQFSGSFANQVIVDPGAVFTGKVQGGTGSNTLELAAGTAGATGTLSGFGTSFTNFDTITIDPGANWQFDATDTISKNVTLTDQGTLANAGVIDTGATLVGGASLANTGTIKGLYGGEFADGVYIEEGVGTVTNAGTIAGYLCGVFLGGGGSVDNTGTIMATGSGLSTGVYIFGGTLTNSGDIQGLTTGVALADGGTIINTGYIGDTGNSEFHRGIFLASGAATVVNAGTIVGVGGTAIQFKSSSANRLIVDPGAVFSGNVLGGSGTNTLELAEGTTGATGTLSGFGTSFTSFGTIVVDSGAKWELDGAVSGTLENAGLLVATVTMDAGGTVSNTGTIDAGAASYGITLLAGGTVSNTGQGALIEGSRYGIRAAGGAATIINDGTILGTSGVDGGGIGLYAGGTVFNTGAINGAGDFGIYITGGAATVSNAGSIGGAAGAVYFKGSTIGRVILDPGAVFQGKVVGGSGSNTLELATGTAGAIGTLSGFGTSFTNFSTITIDPGAKWQFDATDTIGQQVTLTDLGTLANAGLIDTEVKMVGGASLANTGTIKGLYGSAFAGVYLREGFATVTNAGTIAGFTYGVFLGGRGSVGNTGTIKADSSNKSTGVAINGGTLTNSGDILAFDNDVILTNGGTVINTGYIGVARNFINGVDRGIYLRNGASTVVNAGTIFSDGTAIQFTGSYADRLIVDPGAVFIGTVQGGSGTNTLELAAGTAGATGTLSGFGTSFTNFGTIIVDSGAKWQFDSSGTVGSGVSLTDGGAFLGNAGAIDTTVTLTASGTFANTGTVEPGSSANYALTLQAGGVVTNAGAIVSSLPNKGAGVRIDGGAGTLGNSGTIMGGGDGVALTDGGTVTNSGSIGGTSKVGVYIGGAAGTVTNTGTISGGAYAVEFHGSGTPGGFANRLIIDPGAAFQGKVQGGGPDSTIELAAGATGTLSSFGASFTNFGSIVIDSGAKWELDGASPSGQEVTLAGTGDVLALGTPGSFADAIVGFGLSDKLDLTGLAYSSGATATLSGNTLTVTSGGTTDTFTLDGVAAGTKFHAMDDGAPNHGTLVQEAACYCRGTRILTGHGEVDVENLNIGDLIVTASGASRPIKWIGRRAYAPHFANANPRLLPIRFRAGSLGENLPLRDLHVSPKHAMFIDGVLIPAECLVNGVSIVKTTRVDTELAYWHIELETHDVLLAEAAPSETFVDDNSRSMFHNAHEYWAEHPLDIGRQAIYCAPRVEDGYELAAIRARLAEIAGIAKPPTHGGLAGYFAVGNGSVSGWARNELYPGASVCLDILVDGKRVAQTLANQTLPALAAGPHAFDIRLPAAYRGAVQVRRSIDGANLPPASPRAQAA